MPARQQYFADLGQGFLGGYICSESASSIRCYFSHTGIHRSRNQGVEMRVAPLTVNSSELLAAVLLPIFPILCSAGLVVLVSKGGMLPPGDTTMIPLNWKLRLSSQPFLAPHPPESTGKEGVTLLAGLTDPHCQREIELLLHNRGKEKYVWNTGHSSGCLLVFPCPVVKINRKLQQSNSGRTANDLDPLGMKS